MGLGVVLRNEKGEVLACACYKRPPVSDFVMAKTVALWYAVDLCNELGFNKVIFEGDAQLVVEAVNSEDEDLFARGHIIEDIKTVFKGRSAWKVKFIRREENGVAHLLAKNTLDIVQEQI
ncbi:uncharacterized protein LOC121267270 [Juglans microcarpa x Juglans regia]|uniref:uncharacterized protein LOC121267270 n=1 Tax=Juglans microcarpa x Juglans regia TaxID=2249226 RepID=UPI001B7EE400|nr:uncharacterized protein LOC121267270 [Juglans microcarpa x Juglans regia]